MFWPLNGLLQDSLFIQDSTLLYLFECQDLLSYQQYFPLISMSLYHSQSAWLIFFSAQTMPKPIPADGISPNLHRKCCIACISGSAARIVVVEAACAIIQSTSCLLAYSFTGNPNALLLELSKLPWCQKFSVSFSLVLLKCSVFNKTPVSQQSSVSILIL